MILYDQFLQLWNDHKRTIINRFYKDVIFSLLLQKPVYSNYSEQSSWYKINNKWINEIYFDIKESKLIYINLTNISKSHYLTLDVVQSNPFVKWDFYELSMNPCINFDFVKEYIDKLPWNFFTLSLNPNITWTIVKNNPQIPWKYNYLSQNINITLDIILQNPDKPWNYCFFSKNLNLTPEIVLQYPNLPWNYHELSNNPNMNLDLFKHKTQNLTIMSALLQNPFNNEKDKFIRNLFRKYFKENIFEELMASVWHPRNFHNFQYLE